MKAKTIKTRIRWTLEEKAAVVKAAKALNGAKLSSEQRLAKAQSVLPKGRRRPFAANLSSWLNKVAMDELPLSPAKKPVSSDAVANIATQALVTAGASILKQILMDKDVQKALRAALR